MPSLFSGRSRLCFVFSGFLVGSAGELVAKALEELPGVAVAAVSFGDVSTCPGPSFSSVARCCFFNSFCWRRSSLPAAARPNDGEVDTAPELPGDNEGLAEISGAVLVNGGRVAAGVRLAAGAGVGEEVIPGARREGVALGASPTGRRAGLTDRGDVVGATGSAVAAGIDDDPDTGGDVGEPNVWGETADEVLAAAASAGFANAFGGAFDGSVDSDLIFSRAFRTAC